MSAISNVRIRIKTATHTHGGELVTPGTILDDISPNTARQLVASGIAEILSGPTPAAGTTSSGPAPTGGTN